MKDKSKIEKEEIWKPIPGYDGDYMVSDQGRVKSFKKHNGTNERILKPNIDREGYSHVRLSKNGKVKNIKIHKLVTNAFLNHKTDGHTIVVDHVDEDRTNNRLENLQLISQRENCVRSLSGVYSSNFTGVCWHKKNNKWFSNIYINKTLINLGYFEDEEEASNMYNKALELKDLYTGNNKMFRNLIKTNI